MGREGLETALFIWSATQATTNTRLLDPGPVPRRMLGILTAVALGFAFYKGVLKINLAKFFRYTGIILIVVAAGVLSYGVHDLQEAGVLPGLNNLAFDVSNAIPPASWWGTLLKGTVNFSPATTWLEATAWVLYLVPTMTIFLLRTRQPRPASASTTPRQPAEAA